MKNKFLVVLFVFLQFISFVLGQTRPIITPLVGGFNFPNQVVEEHPVAFNANTLSCGFNFTRFYKYYSFKANFDMAFAFDLISSSSDFKFLVWKLDQNVEPESIFNTRPTILPQRSVENNFPLKGMREDDTQLCEGFGTTNNGFVKAFTGTDLLLKDQTVVIAVYGSRITDRFDIKVNVAEERVINQFNNQCIDNPYTYNQVLEAIRTETSLTNITLYSDQNFQNLISVGTIFSLAEQTIYAQVKDALGNLKYIYTVNLKLREFDDFQQFFTVENSALRRKITCETVFNWQGKQWYLNDYLNLQNPSHYDVLEIKYTDVNGVERVISDPENAYQIPVPANGTLILAVLTKSVNPTLCDNQSYLAFTITNQTLHLNSTYSLAKCDGSTINKTEILNLIFPEGSADYNLITDFGEQTTLNFGATNQLTFPVRVEYGVGCITNTVNIVVQKTSPQPIIDANLQVCFNDFTQQMVEDKINEIKNGTTTPLRYFYNGNEVDVNQIYSLIQQERQGEIEVRSEVGCLVTKTFRFSILSSSIIPINQQKTEQSFCVLPSEIINYNTQQLKEIALSNITNAANISAYTFVFLDENNNEISALTNLQESRTIKVLVKLNTELCWQSFTLLFNRVNRLVIADATSKLTANCDDTIILTKALLANLFGDEVNNYHTTNPLNVTIPIRFNGLNEVQYSIDFYLENGCTTTKEITIKKGASLNVDLDNIQQIILQNPYRFCGTINASALEDYLNQYVNQILVQYPTLETEESIFVYAQRMIANNGNVQVVFLDRNLCGTVSVVFNYQPYPSPNLTIEDIFYTCTGVNYQLDLSAYLNPKVMNDAGIEIVNNNSIFSLDLGRYTVVVSNEFGCTTTKTITVLNSPLPIINEIVLNPDSITILATSNGGNLEYSIDGVNWQSSATFLNIAKGVSYTVYVRENGCAIVTIPNVVYLNLPNFISPNGDGINDVWRPIGANSTLNVRIQIFDRYGKVIYQAEGSNALSWNGRVGTKPLAAGSYWYYITYNDDRALIKLKYQGYITIKPR